MLIAQNSLQDMPISQLTNARVMVYMYSVFLYKIRKIDYPNL
jgi:hypothetical protein